jgi:hypothetical protein
MTEQVTGEDKTSPSRFIESLKADKQFTAHRPFIRVMPKGLFVDERAVDALLLTYQAWLSRETEGVASKSIEKCKYRLFTVDEPERMYLTEGKTVLVGYLAPVVVKAPQQYGLPYYLGSLLSTKDYIHPADPSFAGLDRVKVQQGRQGIEAIISRRDQTIIISQQIARDLLEQAKASKYLQRRYPGIDTELSVALRTAISIARLSRAVPRNFPMLVPHRSRSGRGKGGIRFAGKFLLIEEKGVIQQILEMNGRNLSSFLRKELHDAPRERLGSFHLMSKHRDLVGYYESGGRRTSVHARAFGEFIGFILRAKDSRERFTGWFTAAEAFEKFSSFFQLAQPIDRKKLAGPIEALGLDGASYRVYGGWVFVLSKEGTVMRCVAKHIRMVGQKRGAKGRAPKGS